MPEPRKRFEGRHWSGRESPMGGAGTDVWTEPLIPDGRWESWRPFLWFKMTAAQGSILHVHGLTEIRVATWSCWSSECMENSITFCHDWPPGLDRIQWLLRVKNLFAMSFRFSQFSNKLTSKHHWNPLTFKLTILVIELPWSGPTFRPLLLGQGPGELPGTCH